MGLINGETGLSNWCLYDREHLEMDTHMEEHHVQMNADLRGMLPQDTGCQRRPANHQKSGVRMEQVLPQGPQEEATLLTLDSILDSGPQNCEMMHFCYLIRPVCGPLLRQAKQTRALRFTILFGSENVCLCSCTSGT